jgi:hypothetical protein
MAFAVIPPSLALYNERLAVTLGIITLISGIGVFVSCRSCVSLLTKIGVNKPLDNTFFKLLYSYHPYFWWLFWMGLILHFTTAFFHTGFPIAGDPDAPVHWWILGLGFGSLLLVPTVLLSCRSIASAFEFMSGRNPLGGKLYRGFYRLHGYYWWPLMLLVIAHFLVAGNHIGFWPHQAP